MEKLGQFCIHFISAKTQGPHFPVHEADISAVPKESSDQVFTNLTACSWIEKKKKYAWQIPNGNCCYLNKCESADFNLIPKKSKVSGTIRVCLSPNMN